MIPVAFPEPQFRIQNRGGKRFIFDGLRRRWLLLTEEEWVRQNMVAYLTQTLHYPKEAVALEKAILVNGLKKRFDMLVFDRDHQPWLLVECKAPQVPLSEGVLQQVLRYHVVVPAMYLVITNGRDTIGWEKRGGGLEMVKRMPEWGEGGSRQ